MIGTNKSYAELLCHFVPKPIETDEDYDKLASIVDELLDLPAMTEDEREFLDLVSALIGSYEQEHYSDLELRGIKLVKGLLEEQGLKQKDLVHIFKTDSIVSAVLNGHRRMTVAHIEGLAEFFRLPHGYFFESASAVIGIVPVPASAPGQINNPSVFKNYCSVLDEKQQGQEVDQSEPSYEIETDEMGAITT